MSDLIKITSEEISQVKSKIKNEVIYNEEYPQYITIKSLNLPAGWITSSEGNKTNLLLKKTENSWEILVDSTINQIPSNANFELSDYANEGWCEIEPIDKSLDDISNLLKYLEDDLSFEFRDNIQETSGESLGIIKNIVSYQNDRKLHFVYEYMGQASIMAQEVYDFNNHLIKTLEVREMSDGWITQEWDGKNSQGHEVNNGFYILKLRSSQIIGEISKIEIIHKNFAGEPDEK